MARLDPKLPPLKLFAFRLPEEEADSLRQLAAITDKGNTSALLRDMIGAVCSGDPERIAKFNERVLGALGRQLTLDMIERATVPNKGDKPAKARALAKRKGGRRRARKP